MLNFVKRFFSIYLHDHMIFAFQFIHIVYHTGWFANIEKNLCIPEENSTSSWCLIKVIFSTSVLVIGLFIFSSSSWFRLGRLYLSKNLSIFFLVVHFIDLELLVVSLMILCISVMSIVVSPFSFLMLLIWGLSLFSQ